MRLLFVADGRSPTALNWIEYFTKSNYEVHLASTFACQPDLKLASLHIVPVALSASAGESTRTSLRRLIPAAWRTQMRSWLGPLTLASAAGSLRDLVHDIKPDLVHAMRIPYEGMLTATADIDAPVLVSVWGNDFTLHARSNPLMGSATRKTLAYASGLHTDTQRDQRLAAKWGFDQSKPAMVLPGNGGVRSEIFFPTKHVLRDLKVVNPRGLRAYVRNDVFFQSVPKVLERFPGVRFDCPAMLGEPEADRWVKRLGIAQDVNLLPKLNAADLAEVYRAAQVMVSPSTHDGTPNSLLEAMACGVFPVCGDLDSIREWIRPGENGLLVDPADPDALTAAIIQAIEDTDLRARAAAQNIREVAERADYPQNMKRVEVFYSELV
ncbi:MAG: glycosyltransferase family 4 protein [Anaerolineales bacterium]